LNTVKQKRVNPGPQTRFSECDMRIGPVHAQRPENNIYRLKRGRRRVVNLPTSFNRSCGRRKLFSGSDDPGRNVH
jgi:hypothetical protein